VTDDVDNIQNDIRHYDLASVVRRLDCLSPEKKKLGESSRLADESVRLSQNVALSFSGPSLDSLETLKGKHRLRLSNHFLGLLGSNGPLPLHYTEYADQRARHHRDPTFAEFLDIFNHRMLSHFYRAIAIFDPTINMDRPKSNEFDLFIGALGGYAPSASKKRDVISDHTKHFYSGWFSNKAKSPDGVKAIINGHFGFDVAVTEFIGGWLKLPTEGRAMLGHQGVQLGKDLYIGKRVWSISHKFKITLGPMQWNDYVSFQPGGSRCKELEQLVKNYIGDEWDWDLELRVFESRVQPLVLNKTCSLGFTSWLTGKEAHTMAEQSVVINKSMLH